MKLKSCMTERMFPEQNKIRFYNINNGIDTKKVEGKSEPLRKTSDHRTSDCVDERTDDSRKS